MCNHYEGHPEAIPTWADFIGYRAPADIFNDAKPDIWPRRQAPVAIVRENERVVDMLQWGVPRTIPGKRPGSMIKKRSEEHTSELKSLMRLSYAVLCLKKKKTQ